MRPPLNNYAFEWGGGGGGMPSLIAPPLPDEYKKCNACLSYRVLRDFIGHINIGCNRALSTLFRISMERIYFLHLPIMGLSAGKLIRLN